ncbi:branched-chain-amino-acid aminotransferase 6-like isoform X2 [Rosa rugosa]|uniref:branched-chain-amino-acid transaminase n=1 Tax=Rosa chinensis TaxID=74649 RepID=A0A2P6PJR3_ROSCH|nr:branched-chain-amino-acid aminotransferase 6 [Rosa chinensis]XP_062024238.1 branched-chain-amino-acid aminotransferase 6-like isoform X2 [Rosa rugosa]PRQ22172.1 putative transaminase [Rosa chinensis]
MIDTLRIPAMSSSALQTTGESNNHSLKNGEMYADGINWDDLGFGLIPIDYMYTMKCSDGENFSQGHLSPFGKIELCPSAGILNYGQGLFEGLKATRTEDGRIMLFRPQENALRMKMGAERMCMPSPSVEQFVDAVKQTVFANKRWVPPPGKGSLYIRPLLVGSGSNLGLGPGLEYTFLIFASPVGNYHKGRAALNLYVEHKIHRATPGGTGGVKSVTNYSPVYQTQQQARAKGFSDVLFLDSATGKNIEEIVAANIFILKGNVISTPTLKHGTILPGVTRKSIIDIALDFGYQVEERVIPVEDLLAADEAFCTGTAVVVNPIGAVTYQDKRVEYKTGGALCQKLYETLTGIQTGRLEDKKGWTLEVN